MKHYFIILTFLISACGQSGKQSNDRTQVTSNTANSAGTFSMTEIDRDYFDYAKQNNKTSLNIDTTSIQKHNGQIKLLIHNGDKDSTLMYKDKKNPNNEEADITYNYLGYYKHIDKYLLESVYYEGADYDLISRDGSKTNIWSNPIFSNDNDYFACIKPYGLEGEAVGIQIWKIKSDLMNSTDTIQFDKVLELNQLLFNPVDCRWDIDGSLLIQAEKMKDNFYPKDPIETYYLKLKFK
jgi:hypothetical protein